MECALYLPGEQDTPINFAVEAEHGRMAEPYRVVAPMAWEYPYDFGQAQESLQDRLVTASLYRMRLVRPGYINPQACPAPAAAAETPAAKEAACAAYVTDAYVSNTQEPDCRVAAGPDGRAAFVFPEACCEAMEGMPCYFATVEQWIAHWNTFHVAGCPANFHTGSETVDAFFRQVQNRHSNLSEKGKWPRLNQMVRMGLSVGPNTCYWSPSLGNGLHLRPDQVSFLTPEEMQDPFLAARWVARTEFHALMRKDRLKPKKDGKAHRGGRPSSREAPDAKRRRGRDNDHSATDESDSGAASRSTSLTGSAPSTSGTQRGRPRGDKRANTFTRQAARRRHEAAEKASQALATKPGGKLFLSL